MAAMVVVFQTLGVEAKDPSLYPSCHSGSSLVPPPLPPLLPILMLLLVSMLVLRELQLTPELWQPLPYEQSHRELPENNMFPSLFCGVYRCRPSSPIFGEQRHHT